MPEDLRLLALSVAPPAKPYAKNDSSGMTGKMAVVQWVPSSGREARHDFDAQRGSSANFPGQKPPAKSGEPAGRATDFITNAVVLDMAIAQGEKGVNGTGEIVVVDGQGRLRVYSQLEGELEDALLRAMAAAATERAPDETPTVRPGEPTPTRGPRVPIQEGGPPPKYDDSKYRRPGEP